MSRWKDCGEAFIEHDTVRWREAIWKPRRTVRAKAVKIGQRVVTAEVVKCDSNGWVELEVKSCATKRADTWWKEIPDLKPGKIIRRRRGTLGEGGVQRHLWSDESARSMVTSRFFKACSASGASAPERGGKRRR